jgi:hypothetical protein
MVLRLSRALSSSAVASFYVALMASGCSEVKKDSAACVGDGCFVQKICQSDSECALGQYCGSDNKCTAECTPGDQSCGEGKKCTDMGKCVATDIIMPPVPIPTVGGNIGVGGIPNTAGNGGSGGGGGSCVKAEVKFSKVIPNIMLVVDRSGSMKEPFGAGSRWSELRNALIDPTTGFVTTLEDEVRFGLTLYTIPNTPPRFPTGGRGGTPAAGSGGGGGTAGGSGGASAGGGAGGAGGDPNMCPWLVEVPVALNNLAPISEVYLPNDWKNGTPTGESLAAVWPKVRDIDQTVMPGPNFIILATDGEPNTCESWVGGQPGPEDLVEGRQMTVDAVTAAYAAGITTYVISVGEDVAEEHLREVANLGQGQPAADPEERFYVAGDTQQLVAALQDIIVGVRPCEFDLEGTVDLKEANKGVVVIDGNELTYMDPNGWELVSDKRVKLNGMACDLIRNGAMSINIDFPCGVFIPTIPE